MSNPCSNPPFALRISGDSPDATVKLHEAIMAGRVTATICNDWPMYEKGSVILYDESPMWLASATIVAVWRTNLAAITAKELLETGCVDYGEAMRRLCRDNSDTTTQSPLLFIRWTNIRGKSVDAYRKSHPNSYCC